MTLFDPDLAEMRFGYGLSPDIAAPSSRDAMLTGFAKPDVMAEAFPIETFDVFRERLMASVEQLKIRRKNRGNEIGEAARKERSLLNKSARQAAAGWAVQSMMRAAYTPHGFRERMAAFWADHFTARGKQGVIRRATAPYIDDAIRPNLSGSFADMLKAAATHPLMVHYLDQTQSAGENSKRAMATKGRMGLNENLAREVLELHTLGVGGPYNQTDVRELAELFAGMTFDPRNGRKYRKDLSEPGAETILGVTYSDHPGMRTIHAALDDLARHPATADHIARKLAVHFTSDAPDPDLVAHISAAFRASDGDLMQVYTALLDHPAAWTPELTNIKPPIDFMTSTFRAITPDPARLKDAKERDINRAILGPLLRLGQPWQRPAGPDGWEEADSHWVTPQGMAWRVKWAMGVPKRLRPDLPDPRIFAQSALGTRLTEPVRFAAAAAESRPEAIGLVLMSPSFQRR